MIAFYDGTPLLHPSEDVLQYAKTDGMFKPEDYFKELPHYSKLQLGQLYWPTGASRFGAGFFLVSSDFLEKLPKYDVTGANDSEDTVGGLRSTVNYMHRYEAKNLDLIEGDKPLQAKLWMLPPRPLFQQRRVPSGLQENIARIPYSHLNGIWVLPLVDARYWWRNFTTGDFQLPSCATWETLFITIFKKLGYTDAQITIDPISVDYLFPHTILRSASQFTDVPALLDTIAYSCGTRVILNYDGTVRVMNAAKSFEEDSTRYSTSNTQKAGGFGSLISTAKTTIGNNYSAAADITKNATEFKKLKSIMRDTAGVIPRSLSFIMSGTVYPAVTTKGGGETGTAVNADGDDNTFSAFMGGGQVYYFTSTDEIMEPPAFTRNIGGTTEEPVIPVSGDYAYDLRKKLLYPYITNYPAHTTSWGDPSAGESLPSVYLKLNASSYKSKVKQCPEYAQKPTNKTDREFSQLQLKNFIEVYKNDWILYQMSDVNLILNGVEKIDPTGLFDYVMYDIANICTKVVRPPYNEQPHDIWIESYLGDEAGCDSDTHPCGTCKGMQSDDMSFGPLIGRGIPENFLPFSPIKVRGQSVPSSYVVTTAGLLNDYPWYHTPPYVAKFCLGSATGTVALDFHFLVPGEISVYWDGQKVASRKTTGANGVINKCSDFKGRITFAKTTKTPTYATVVVDTTDNTSWGSDSNTFKKQNWAVNMRCVDSQPFPAPLDMYCAASAKLDEVPSVILLGMFTPPQSYVPGQSYGSYTTTTVCDGNPPTANFKCNGTDTTIPDNLFLTFETPPASCSYLKDVVIDLQKSTTGGGWSGIFDGLGPKTKLVIANLRLSGTEGGATLRILDLLDGNKELVSVNNPMCVTSAPFKMQFLSGNLDLLSCVGTTTKIVIKEA